MSAARGERTRLLDDISNHEAAEALVDEIRAALEGDRWAALATEGGVDRIYIAAAVAHCTRLLEELVKAARAGLELGVRTLGRTHMEAIVVALYLTLGGRDALLKVAGSYRAEIRKWHNDIEQHNGNIRRLRKETSRRQQAVRVANQGISSRNETSTTAASPLLPEPQIPALSTIDLDLNTSLAAASVVEEHETSTRDLIVEVDQLLRDSGDLDASLVVAYNYVFRTLSTLGVHTNLKVLDSYISDRDRNFLRVKAQPDGEFGDAVLATAIVMTAFVAQHVLSREAELGAVPHTSRVWEASARLSSILGAAPPEPDGSVDEDVMTTTEPSATSSDARNQS